jgi:hypothetical protein
MMSVCRLSSGISDSKTNTYLFPILSCTSGKPMGCVYVCMWCVCYMCMHVVCDMLCIFYVCCMCDVVYGVCVCVYVAYIWCVYVCTLNISLTPE